MHDMVCHDRWHIQALSLQLLENLSLFPDVFTPTFPLPPLDNIHLRWAFSALQMYRVPSDGHADGGSRVSALVVSRGGVWMRCSVISDLPEAAHGWVAVTGGDDLMQEFLPGMNPAKPFFLICPQYIRPYSALLDGHSAPRDAATDVPVLHWVEAEMRCVPLRHLSMLAVLQPAGTVCVVGYR